MDAILPVVTLIIGYFGTLLTEYFRDSRGESRESQRHHAEQQREILIELQENLQRLTRTVGHESHLKAMAYRDSGSWDLQPMDSELVEMDFNARVRVIALTSRVADGRARELARNFRTAQVEWLAAQSLEEDRATREKFMTSFDTVMDHIGELLRSPPTK